MPLARRAAVRVVLAPCVGIEAAARRVLVEGREPLPFDVASFDIGSTVAGLDLPGVREHAVPTRPINRLAAAISGRVEALASERPNVAVVGSGAGGLELAFCIDARLRGLDMEPRVTIVEAGGRILPGYHPALARRIEAAARARGIRTLVETPVAAVEADSVQLEDGGSIDSDLTFWVTGAAALPIFRGSGLPLCDRGFVRTRSTLQVEGHDNIFAVGDCATLIDQPDRPRAGVYAVRMGPYLIENLERLATGQPLRRYRPQGDFLSLLNLGDGRAAGAKWGAAFEGCWVMRLKDRIDRRFMERFQTLDADGAPLPAFPPMEARPGGHGTGRRRGIDERSGRAGVDPHVLRRLRGEGRARPARQRAAPRRPVPGGGRGGNRRRRRRVPGARSGGFGPRAERRGHPRHGNAGRRGGLAHAGRRPDRRFARRLPRLHRRPVAGRPGGGGERLLRPPRDRGRAPVRAGAGHAAPGRRRRGGGGTADPGSRRRAGGARRRGRAPARRPHEHRAGTRRRLPRRGRRRRLRRGWRTERPRRSLRRPWRDRRTERPRRTRRRRQPAAQERGSAGRRAGPDQAARHRRAAGSRSDGALPRPLAAVLPGVDADEQPRRDGSGPARRSPRRDRRQRIRPRGPRRRDGPSERRGHRDRGGCLARPARRAGASGPRRAQHEPRAERPAAGGGRAPGGAGAAPGTRVRSPDRRRAGAGGGTREGPGPGRGSADPRSRLGPASPRERGRRSPSGRA